MRSSDIKEARAKLFVLFAIPFFIYLFISTQHITQYEDRVLLFEGIEKQVELSKHISSLVHELQKERGTSVVFLASKGEAFFNELALQREATDDAYNRLNRFFKASLDSFNSHNVSHLLSGSFIERKALDEYRVATSFQHVSEDQITAYFSKIIRRYIDAISAIALKSVESELSMIISAYKHFLLGKELAGIERAMLSRIFSKGYFADDEYLAFVELIKEQDVHQQLFLSITTDSLAQSFKDILSGPHALAVEQYRAIAHEYYLTGEFGVDVSDWFAVKTAKIDQLKLLEYKIMENLQSKVERFKDESSRSLITWRVSVILTSLVMVVIAFLIMRRIGSSFGEKLKEFKELFERSTAGMMVVNPKNRCILFCNATFADMTGMNKQYISTLSLYDIHPKATVLDALKVYSKAEQGDFDWKAELSFNRKDQDAFQGEVSAFPIEIEGQRYIVQSIKDITQRKKVMDENDKLLRENRALAQRNYILQEAERRDIARELHDQLGQELVGVMLQADCLNDFAEKQDRNGVRSAAASIATGVRSIIQSTRDLTNKLRPVTLDQLGIEAALRELIDNWAALNIKTLFEFNIVNELPELNEQVSICIYRLVQENLTNIEKHSQASEVVISLRYDADFAELNTPVLTLVIADNGVGMDNQSANRWGMGVINMRERVQSLGGLFKLNSNANCGVTIIANIPIVTPQL